MNVLIPLLFFFIILVSAIVPIVLILWLSQRYMQRAEGQCYHCGYPMRGSTSPLCPECGADWHDASARKTIPRWLELVAIPACIILPTLLMLGLFIAMVAWLGKG